MYIYRLTLLALILPVIAFAQSPGPVHLDEKTVINLAGYHSVSCFFDAQTLLPPTPPPTGDTLNWGCGLDVGTAGTYFYYPMMILIDLGVEREVTDICIYDFEGFRDINGDGFDDIDPGAFMEFEYGNPYDGIPWTYAANVNLVYNFVGWRCTSLASPITTRYLRFELPSPDANIGELAVYCNDNTPVVYTPDCSGPAAVKPVITFDQLLGTNFNYAENIPFLQAIGQVREYHYWTEDDTVKSITSLDDLTYGLNPSEGLTGWSFDSVYTEIKDYGVDIALDNSWGSFYTRVSDEEEAPVWPLGSDVNDPESYSAFGDYMFQLAARYGSKTFNPAQEVLLKTPDKKSGLNMVSYMENWNEQNKWWKNGYFTPEMYAAMSSTAFDGHELAFPYTLTGDPEIPAWIGTNNADPDMKTVFAGTAGLSLNYVKAVKVWFEQNRADCRFPYDAISLHNYSGTRAEFDRSGDTQEDHGLSPEAWGLRSRLEEISTWRDEVVPGVELWLTEFGYDTNPYSPIKIPMPSDTSLWINPTVVCDTGKYECAGVVSYCSNPIVEYYDYDLSEEIQGQWLLRSWLETAAAGFDRAHMYNLEDLCTEDGCCVCFSSGSCPWDFSDKYSGYKYRSTGFIKKIYGPDFADLGDQPKRAWWYTYTLKRILEGTVFESDESECIGAGCGDPTTCPVSNSDAPQFVRSYRFDHVSNPNYKVFSVWSPTSCLYTFTNYNLNIGLPVDSVTLVEMTVGEIDGTHSRLPVVAGVVTLPAVSEMPRLIVAGDEPFDMQGCNCAVAIDSVTGDGNIDVLVNDQASLDICNPVYFGNAVNWSPGFAGQATFHIQPTNVEAIHLLDDVGEGRIQIIVEHTGGIDDWIYETKRDNYWRPFMGLNYQGVTKVAVRMLDPTAFIGEVAICGKPASNNNVTLSGNAGVWCGGAPVSGVTVSLSTPAGTVATALTDAGGNYSLTAPADQNYRIDLQKSDDANCGVDILDYQDAANHFGMITALPIGYALIAADVNGDKRLKNYDLQGIQAMASGMISSFEPYGGWSWRFLDAAAPFPTAVPLTLNYINVSLKDYININPSADVSGLDFTAIKAGDVNCDCILSLKLAESKLQFNVRPNPTSGEAWLDVESKVEGEASVFLYDVTGRVINSFKVDLRTGINTVKVEGLENAPSGVLSWHLKIGGELISGRVVKLN